MPQNNSIDKEVGVDLKLEVKDIYGIYVVRSVLQHLHCYWLSCNPVQPVTAQRLGLQSDDSRRC